MMRRAGGALVVVVGLMACKGAASTSAGAGTSASMTSASATTTASVASVLGGTSCGAVGGVECATFDRAEDAFLAVLKEDPAVLAIGEAHAQRGATVASSAKRFADTLLPLLAGRASDLLVELMMPPTGCVKQAEAMRSAQKPVTTQQAAGNQNEYLAMGEAARKLGIVPDLLRPSCQDLAAVEDAGADAIDVSLATIARLTTAQAEKMIDRDRANVAGSSRRPERSEGPVANENAKKMVVTYGGALHNDTAPPPERAGWAFGPALSKYVGGRYVELDLYVPEFIEDTDTWRALPFYAAYQKAKSAGKPTLFRVASKSYVLVFAPSTPAPR
ncbi:MAG TPA: hypothetical protein VLM85_20335 [Polyangiaceae bacterium]|nr:hypothetical protein [Polyangiaceae bacterium]